MPVENRIVFYSFVIDHEIPFAYEGLLCVKSGRPDKDAIDPTATSATPHKTKSPGSGAGVPVGLPLFSA